MEWSMFAGKKATGSRGGMENEDRGRGKSPRLRGWTLKDGADQWVSLLLRKKQKDRGSGTNRIKGPGTWCE
jgi:hypothetical protein